MGTLSGELLDSVIVIDHLNGIDAATTAINQSVAPTISVVSWIDVLAGLHDPAEEARGRVLLSTLPVIPLSDDVAEEAVVIRRDRRLKFPDAVIYATARVHGLTLITRNTKDFLDSDPGIRVPYRL
jgi:predicted nucleic acid-binding protein